MTIYSDELGYKLTKLNCSPVEISTIKNSFPHNVIIRIFGFAGSGKGTLSTGISSLLNLPNIESSLIWRGVTHIYLDLGLENSLENSQKIFSLLNCKPGEHGELIVYYGANLISRELLKRPEIDANVSKYSSVDFNREMFYEKMIEFLKYSDSSCILDGRGAYPRYIKEMEDSGRKIIRIFLDASDEIKASRYHKARLEKLLKTNADYKESEAEKQQVLQEFQEGIVKRNQDDWGTWVRLDMGTITPDTAVLDTTHLTPEEANQTAIKYIGTKLGLI